MSLFEAEMGEEAVKAFEKEQETVAIGVAMEHSQGNKIKEEMLCYVLFTDFQVVALLPDASGTKRIMFQTPSQIRKHWTRFTPPM